jgi:hypothetical protein
MESSNNQIQCYIKMGKNEEWINGDLTTIGFSSLEELTPFYDQYLDYSFFTKTETGFEIAEEHADEYVAQTLDILSGMLDISLFDDMNIDMYAKYYVCSGVLSGMLTEGTLKMDTSLYGVSMKLDEKFTGKSTCTDYGTTVVEKPF